MPEYNLTPYKDPADFDTYRVTYESWRGHMKAIKDEAETDDVTDGVTIQTAKANIQTALTLATELQEWSDLITEQVKSMSVLVDAVMFDAGETP